MFQNTLILRAIPGLNELGKVLLGNMHPSLIYVTTFLWVIRSSLKTSILQSKLQCHLHKSMLTFIANLYYLNFQIETKILTTEYDTKSIQRNYF